MPSGIITSKPRKILIPPTNRRTVLTPSQREVPSQSEKTESVQDYYISPQSSLEEGWKITPPPWLNKNVISEIVTFKSLFEKDHKLVLEHESVITYLLNERAEMKKEIQELKSQNLQKMDDWGESQNNSKLIREIFNLPKTKKRSVDEILHDMDGCLKDYSYPQGDILEDIRSIRD